MAEFVIEKGIPLPMRAAHKSYPFRDMDVGDSVFLPNRNAARVSAMNSHERKKGKRFAARKWEQNGVQGVRVWRVS